MWRLCHKQPLAMRQGTNAWAWALSFLYRRKMSNVEQLEARIAYFKDDSKMCTHRIKYYEEKRKWIQREIKKTKKELRKSKKF